MRYHSDGWGPQGAMRTVALRQQEEATWQGERTKEVLVKLPI